MYSVTRRPSVSTNSECMSNHEGESAGGVSQMRVGDNIDAVRNVRGRLPAEVLGHISTYLMDHPSELLAMSTSDPNMAGDLHAQIEYASFSLRIDGAMGAEGLTLARFDEYVTQALAMRPPEMAVRALVRLVTEMRFGAEGGQSTCLHQILSSRNITEKGKAWVLAILAQKLYFVDSVTDGFDRIENFVRGLPAENRSAETLARTLDCLDQQQYHAGTLVGLVSLAANQPSDQRGDALRRIIVLVADLPPENRASPLFQAARFLGYFDDIWGTSRSIREAVMGCAPKHHWGVVLTCLRYEALRWSKFNAGNAIE